MNRSLRNFTIKGRFECGNRVKRGLLKTYLREAAHRKAEINGLRKGIIGRSREE